MKKILAIVLCACMICALLAGCGSSESPAAAVEGDVLKIGIFEPATGENGAGGMQEVLGARYANKVVPSVTVNGKEYKIELVEVDNQSDKTAAVTAAQNCYRLLRLRRVHRRRLHVRAGEDPRRRRLLHESAGNARQRLLLPCLLP